MLRLKSDHQVLEDTSFQPLPAWDKFVPIATSVLMLSLICLFLTSLMAQLGPFPTVFLTTVAAVTVVMQLGELTTPRRPQL
ncbi:hypothetical protein NG895_14335 [Aeoliella sp. ICT_H6.2]|uniref:Uncharacterized protein n=1 Tax=Aeoliella straminimaris TaxID=2954799 RepID=A0A9X2JGI9_9BACT|nr:hypothetical protein [Aeoliella straminimaris]MCO6045085.1 hypothetical protein [Aeoliella straminimaris]